VFVSFDFDNDKVLKEGLIGQSKIKESPFEVFDCSLKEAEPEQGWEEKAKQKIKEADLVIVMLGERTHKAQGVLKEVQIARSLNKKIIQLIGHKNTPYQRIKGAGCLYHWNWENLKKVLQQ
jgi:tRNA U34 5-carboxymethylaminomethyl modifying GTPase MnmE/TrmE